MISSGCKSALLVRTFAECRWRRWWCDILDDDDFGGDGYDEDDIDDEEGDDYDGDEKEFQSVSSISPWKKQLVT